jgi:hypothetical protein
MRTTVTLDPDVEQLLHEAMRQTQESFKVTLNQAIRKGLAGMGATECQEPFVVSPLPMGLRTGIEPTQLQSLGDELEVDAFLNLTRHLLRDSKALP